MYMRCDLQLTSLSGQCDLYEDGRDTKIATAKISYDVRDNSIEISKWQTAEKFRHSGYGKHCLRILLNEWVLTSGTPSIVKYIWNGTNKYVLDWMTKHFDAKCKCDITVQKTQAADDWDSHIYTLNVHKFFDYLELFVYYTDCSSYTNLLLARKRLENAEELRSEKQYGECISACYESCLRYLHLVALHLSNVQPYGNIRILHDLCRTKSIILDNLDPYIKLLYGIHIGCFKYEQNTEFNKSNARTSFTAARKVSLIAEELLDGIPEVLDYKTASLFDCFMTKCKKNGRTFTESPYWGSSEEKYYKRRGKKPLKDDFACKIIAKYQDNDLSKISDRGYYPWPLEHDLMVALTDTVLGFRFMQRDSNLGNFYTYQVSFLRILNTCSGSFYKNIDRQYICDWDTIFCDAVLDAMRNVVYGETYVYALLTAYASGYVDAACFVVTRHQVLITIGEGCLQTISNELGLCNVNWTEERVPGLLARLLS